MADYPPEAAGPGTEVVAGRYPRRMKIRAALAYQLRKYADRIDQAGAPKGTSWRFTFERGEGIRFREDGRGRRP